MTAAESPAPARDRSGTADRTRRIAVVGSGVAGLTAAYILSRSAEVTLFEADGRLGGHADTHLVAAGGRELAIDTGFIVHNTRTYPLLCRLFTELGVTTQPTEMSMSVSCDGCGLEYAGQRGLAGLAAGLRRGRLPYLRMLAEVLRFHRAARGLLAGPDSDVTLGEFLAGGSYSSYFQAHFALPFVASVWSCAPQAALDYPARYLFAFLDQHGLLRITGSPPWMTVCGGSASYVERIAKQVARVRTATPVTAVRHQAGRAEISFRGQDGEGTEAFDAAVIAAHPDQALAMLAEPAPAERELLGAFRYSRNPAVLHTDARLLPRARAARASWNYQLPSCAASAGHVQVSYWMNRLQQLPGPVDYLVTLNADTLTEPVPASQVVAEMDYAHPLYDPACVAAQRRLPELNDGTVAFAGAYHGWGFHEDGCRAGVAAARSLGGHW